jgi:4-alpha-glucanotransferase
MRASGILLSISSLPSKYGIGCFSKEAYTFVDQLAEAGQKYWQVLPFGQTSYGDSPYQSFSTFAGNPYFIDPEDLIERKWVTKKEVEKLNFGTNPRYADYGRLYDARFRLLRMAYEQSEIAEDADFQKFCEKQANWLDDYALFMSLKNHFDGVSWSEWDEDIRFRRPEALHKYRELLKDEILFYQFQQYLFMEEWTKLKDYANEKGVKIIGDIPIYVALDSVDVWADPQLFLLDEENVPLAVAGCPPDAFSEDGQLWGNPLYNWQYHKETGYGWWIRRIDHCRQLFDVVRIDHFRGFDEYYVVPYGDETAANGKWMPGPGIELFDILKNWFGELHIIAEDLGFLTDSVYEMVKKTGFPGMKVLQFAFTPGVESDYLPHTYDKNCVVYTGTHDNDTLIGWYQTLTDEEKEMIADYMNNADSKLEDIPMDFIRLAMSSVANLCIIPMQDYLGLDGSCRMNFPSTLGGNWEWRMLPGEFDQDVVEKIKKVTTTYFR